MDSYAIVISHPGPKHWRWALLKNYRSQLATGDVQTLRKAWKAARYQERAARRLGI